MRDQIRPVTDKGKPVPGMAVCDAGPQPDGALRVSINGDTITITALAARGTLPTTVQLPLPRLFALITEAVRTARVHDNGDSRGCPPGERCKTADCYCRRTFGVHDNGDYRA